MKRKFLIVLLSLVCCFCLALGLTACGNSSSGATDDGQNNEQTGNTDDGSSSSGDSGDSGSSSGDSDSTDDGGDLTTDEITNETTHIHIASEVVKENEIFASCSTMGSYDSVVYCSVCNEELSRETITIPKTEHTYNTGVITTESTCEANGIKTYTCTVCGDTYTEAIAANGHTYNSDKVCTVCGAEKVSEGLEYVLSTDKTYYTVSGIGTCADTDLVIPSSYNGLPVTEIGENAFNSCTSIISITIPDSITSIGEYAFIYCYRLVEVYNLSLLKIVAGSRAQGYAGYYAKNVYTASEGESHFVTQDDCQFIYDADNSYYFVSYNGTDTDITLPLLLNGFEISSYAFYCDTEITSVDIPDNVTAIGDYSFYGCTALKEINIPDSVLTIGIYAFENCTSATKLSIGCGVTDIGNSAFYNCIALEQIKYDAVNVENLYNYDRTLNIFDNAGTGSNGITLIIGNNVKCIPANLFRIGEYLNVRIVGGDTCESTSANIVSIEFEENSKCESIGDYAFEGCYNLKNINLPDSITEIGMRAFCACSSLTTVSFENNSNCTSIGNYAFYYCYSLVNLELSNSLKTIGNGAFKGCWSLESISISDSVVSIGASAFSECKALARIEFNDNSNLLTIGDSAFSACSYLSEFIIPNSVNSIQNNAFNDCYSLESIVIPSSVNYIGTYAFYGCDSISITFENTNGWYVTETEGASDGIAIDVTDASQNAKYFKETYCAYYWYRSDS